MRLRIRLAVVVPRRLRIQEEAGVYHVINRGNYRSDVFGTEGASDAFEVTLGESCERYGWNVHAYVLMRNHFHLALETPQPNLADGMHWLQGTFAVRFNRYRKEQGHVFQGRYRSLLIEDGAALAGVCDYIHLNPARAGAVPAGEVAAYRWSSLRRFPVLDRPSWLVATDLLRYREFDDDVSGWKSYVDYLAALATDEAEQARLGFDRMSRGWAIGTAGWRKAVAREHEHLVLRVGIAQEELRQIREARWAAVLADELRLKGKSADDIRRDRKGADWKRAIACALRRKAGASFAWIADSLEMGRAGSVRVYVCRHGAEFNM